MPPKFDPTEVKKGKSESNFFIIPIFELLNVNLVLRELPTKVGTSLIMSVPNRQ